MATTLAPVEGVSENSEIASKAETSITVQENVADTTSMRKGARFWLIITSILLSLFLAAMELVRAQLDCIPRTI